MYILYESAVDMTPDTLTRCIPTRYGSRGGYTIYIYFYIFSTSSRSPNGPIYTTLFYCVEHCLLPLRTPRVCGIYSYIPFGLDLTRLPSVGPGQNASIGAAQLHSIIRAAFRSLFPWLNLSKQYHVLRR